MLSNLYTFHDSVAEEYSAPFLAKNDALAIRFHQRMIEQQQSDPGEFRLIHLGSFNSETSGIELLQLSRVVEVPRTDKVVDITSELKKNRKA